jgi:antitoxin component YwqK of YwqJK toxin-antitoxin module
MAYEILFFYDNRVAILNATSNKLLPMIYNSLNEFILYTVLNNNELIVDFSIYDMIQYEYEERKFSDEDSKRKFEEETCSKYDCKEIPIKKIKQTLPSDGATIEYDSSILKVFDSKQSNPIKTSCKIEHYNSKNVLVERYTEIDGLRDGKYEKWYDSGVKALERNYKNGKKEGLEQRWYENGQQLSGSYYKDGKRDGICRSWCQNGELFDEFPFKDGKLIDDNDN